MPDTRMSAETIARIETAWPDILARFARGDLIKHVLKAHSLSADMLRAFKQLYPSRRQEWEDAREQSADSLYDEALEVARTPTVEVPGDNGGPSLIIKRDPAHTRTYIDTLKWAARIRNPRLYSDKQTIDLNVKTVDLTKIISEANARLQASRGQVIEGTIVPALLRDLL